MAKKPKELEDIPPVSDAEIDDCYRAWDFTQPLSIASSFKILQPPASTSELAALLASCGKLPASYLSFLGQANGAEKCDTDLDGGSLVLWSSGEMINLNEAYRIQHSLPDFVAIGSDGEDDAIGFDRAVSGDPEKWPVVRIGFGNLDRSDFRTLAEGFQEWQVQGFALDHEGFCCGGG